MPNILISNDDGYATPGLLALKQALEKIGTVHVLAPETNWSATSHMRTLDKPLRITHVKLADGSDANACSGSPADCVALALHGALGIQFDIVVAGINHGYNLGNDVSYSGTVACAKEAVIFGIPGIAVSTAYPRQTTVDLDLVRPVAAEIAAQVAQQVLVNGLQRGTLLNINVPGVERKDMCGLQITRQGWRSYHDELIRREDPYGRPYFWLSGTGAKDDTDDGTDLYAIAHQHVSITPLRLDTTHHAFLEPLRGWSLPLMNGSGL